MALFPEIILATNLLGKQFTFIKGMQMMSHLCNRSQTFINVGVRLAYE